MKNLIIYLIALFPIMLFGQSNNSYNLEVELNSFDKTIDIKQVMKYKNTSNTSVDIIFLEDWSNAYSNTDTKLAKRISDEYSRSFSFSQKKQRGSTIINKISSNNIDKWSRSENASDIIKLFLKEPLKINQSIEIEISYSIKLPDSKFTGFGYDNSNNFYLKNWIIAFSANSGLNLLPQSNLNLDDQSIDNSYYSIKLKLDGDYFIVSNLQNILNEDNERETAQLIGSSVKDVKLNILAEDNFIELKNNQFEVETDIFKKTPLLESENKFNRVSSFISKYFNDTEKTKLLITKQDYESSPFYGLNELPGFLSPFSDEFLEEIIFLKSFSINYINQKLNLNKRDSHWVFKGLEIFIINKYINQFYPKVKFIGKLAANKFIDTYEVSKLNFNDIFINYSEYVQRLNLHQSDSQPSNTLTRINEEIVSPYHTGVGLIYLENLIGKEKFQSLVHKIVNSESIKKLNDLFYDYKENDLRWFIDNYLGSRQSLDLSIRKTSENFYRVSEKNNIRVPYSVGLLKNDSVIYSERFNTYKQIELPKLDYDYVAVNPKVKIPEINQNNNWIYKSRSTKPLRLRLIGDLDNPKNRNIYIRPEVTYNLYDGISPGINIINRGIKNKPFTFEIFSQYASNTENLVGALNLKYQLNDEIRKNYSTIYSIQYKTNHYDENLRYHVFFPSIVLNFRDNKDLRSNIVRTFSLSNYTIRKEASDSKKFLNDYSIYNIGHAYSEIDIVKYLRTSFNSQLSKNFGKINFVFDYRKLLDNNRQFQARLYFGKFLWNKNRDNTYFNYNLSRSGDYLFNGNYIGRSEEDGILSQQFIMAGGGFKSFFENPSTNNFILSTNLNFGIWKWFESYLDLGILKDKEEKSRYFYGTGIRLNILPDFFELYFPVSSNNGFELSQENYSSKIRFIVSYNLESLSKLFTRRWL
tara:strand:+ start:3173 stop:5938 length:2766 start_codon:yes stop_codon:yes gene_type:complete